MDLKSAAEAFSVDEKNLLHEAHKVTDAMETGIKGEKSSLAMLPSFLSLPSGLEKGSFLALDFGGSNIRVARVVLSKGQIMQTSVSKKSLKELSGGTIGGTEELFEKIALFVSDFAGSEGGHLGHTFSYPVFQTGVNEARLKKWTKEISFSESGIFGINFLLYSKLKALGRTDIVPSVLLNDTTAVIMAAAYQKSSKKVIGSICGTGHNTCYCEPSTGMVLNLESGNFAPDMRNEFDMMVDEQSAFKGEQLLEKMVAGDYLARLVCFAARKTGSDNYQVETARQLADILADKSHELHFLSKSVIRRAAALIAAEYLGIYRYLEKRGEGFEIIAIDGSVYEKMPFFKEELANFLQEFFKNPPEIISQQGQSLSGAAVACATLF